MTLRSTHTVGNSVIGQDRSHKVETVDVGWRQPWHRPHVGEVDAKCANEIRESLKRDTGVDNLADCCRVFHLYHDVAANTDGVFVLTTIDKTGKLRTQQFAIGDVDGMVAEVVTRSQTVNVYLAPAVYRKDLPPGSRGKADDIDAVLGVVIDDDGDTGKRATLPPVIEPSITITTSRQPSINRQHQFVFDRPMPSAEAKALAELMHRKCGGDHGGKDINHVWRLPQTLNYPTAAKIKRGRPPEPQRVELTGGSFERVDPDELRRVLEAMPDLHPVRRTNGTGNGYTGGSTDRNEIMAGLPGWVRDLINAEGEGDRSGHCFRAMQALMDNGVTDDEIRLLADGGSFANKFLERGDLDADIARARNKWSGEARRTRAFARQTPRAPQSNTPIDGDALLTRVYKFLGRFVAYPSVAAHVAHALWIAHAHLMDAWDSTPRLAFLSKEPASGKTRGLEVSELLVPRAVEAVNVTPAYLFRKVADPEGRPTILFDEIDTVFGPKAKDNEEIRGLLNAGHRKGAEVGRCVVKGNRVETEEIPAYCAVAMAGLGNLPDTLLSRAVVVRMRRRAPNEKVEPYRRRIHQKDGEELKEQLVLWAENVKESVIADWPEMPPGVEDRDADVWEALIAVADQAGGEWPQRARKAAVTLVALAKESSPSLGIQLLSDLRNIFGDTDAMGTETILNKLHALDEAPWGDLKGKPLDNRALARMLKPYGVKPKSIRTGSGPKDVHKGYKREDLHDPWMRYLPPPEKSVTAATDATGVKGEAS